MLPVNFHKTFIPERRLIGALLHYAALGKEGSYQEISADTGIPMGESTGKVPAILDYARGMGLVELLGDGKGSTKKPALTPFGRAVYSDDRYLGEKLTQWIAHLNLCRKDIGSLVWRAAFCDGRQVLGSSFTRTQLEEFLIGIFGPGNDRTGPLIRTYTDEAAFGRANVLTDAGEWVERDKAPHLEGYAGAYSALILELLEAQFPDQTQVTISEFGTETGLFHACLWNEADVERACALLERKGFIAVDRQMRPWILERGALAAQVWLCIFDDLA